MDDRSRTPTAAGGDDALRVVAGADGSTFEVRVQPRARRDEVAGLQAGCLRVRLQAPPVEDGANRALVRFLALTLGVPRARVELVSGGRSRTKRILVRGQEPAALEAALARFGVNVRLQRSRRP